MRLEHRIDFMLLVSVSNADPNGDPLRNGMPRTAGGTALFPRCA